MLQLQLHNLHAISQYMLALFIILFYLTLEIVLLDFSHCKCPVCYVYLINEYSDDG